MPKKILIVDDEPELVALLEMSLGGSGYEITSAANGAEALRKLQDETPDLILMDVMLPDVSGTRLTGQIKNNPGTADIPVIMLTARDSATDVIVGLNMGADDYVTKPFSTPILAARIETVLRRKAVSRIPAANELSAGGITVKPQNRQCIINGRSIDLTPAEFRILLSLIEAAGAVVKFADLGKSLGLGTGDAAERNIYVHVSSLRRKIGEAKKAIKTVQGLGYRIDTART